MRSSVGQFCPERGAHRSGEAGSVFTGERALLALQFAVRDLRSIRSSAPFRWSFPREAGRKMRGCNVAGTSVALSTTVLS
jgi:hypothetical protein